MITLKQAEQMLTERIPFTAGNLTANWEGLLGDRYIYVVRSYNVEIANIGEGNRFIVSDAYSHSKTTSKHANIVKRAWGLN